VNHVTVFERPGLHEFLKKTSEFADLILFTAGLEGMLAGWLLLVSSFVWSDEPNQFNLTSSPYLSKFFLRLCKTISG
jgi:hypothetical protein